MAKKIKDEELEPVTPVQAPTEDEETDDVPETAPDPLLTELSAPASTPLGTKARAMRDQLAKEPKVRVFIPLANGEKQGVTQSVILNGYPMYIRKGSYVNVPQSVAEVLENKLQHKMSVENHPERVSGDRPVKMTTYGN